MHQGKTKATATLILQKDLFLVFCTIILYNHMMPLIKYIYIYIYIHIYIYTHIYIIYC